jgi:hypothetical protein
MDQQVKNHVINLTRAKISGMNRLRYIKPEAGHATQYAKEVKSKHFRVRNTGPVPHWFQGSQNDAYYAYESFVQGNRFDYDF